ncbi:Uncharacterized protein FWK35_00039271, partial [Aphis craccivora]
SYLISKELQPICTTCNQILTVKHIVEECALYTSIRTDLKMPPNVAEALNEQNTSKIIKFLNITNVIKKFIIKISSILIGPKKCYRHFKKKFQKN